ncbi:hypothetical protein GH714_041192 [Hevea brasiliensis]|uniref:EF-hand domain-containing protein n=1 Tax=Hevea brasiliensis TaxID=3981 RepID=A0A6A6N0A9_HEVBR|nr:hypothetical protein GH714_041192 [Hevea brasiliensis]
MLANILKENNVNNEEMLFDPGVRTALAFVTLRSDEEREFMFYRNPKADISEEEISFLTKGEDPYDDAVVRKLFHPNLKMLLVTEDADGCRYYTKNEHRLRDALKFASTLWCMTVKERGAIPALSTKEVVQNAILKSGAYIRFLQALDLRIHRLELKIMADEAQDQVERERIFKRFDLNGDGKISAAELGDSLKTLGLVTPDEITRMMAEIDTDGDGFISYEEFTEFAKANRGLIKDVAKIF